MAAFPDPIEPENTAPPAKGDGRADWLCGPEEGLEAEMQRKEREGGELKRPQLVRPSLPSSDANVPAASAPQAPVAPSAPPALRRPTVPEAAAPSPPTSPKGFGAVEADAAQSDFHSGPGMIWEPGANSVPAIRQTTARTTARPGTPIPSARRDFPMDDAEERARAREQAAQAAAAAAEFEANPHDPVAPEAFDIAAVPMPWWMQFPHAIRTDRRLQLATAGGALILATIAFWPRGEQALSLGELNHHPEKYNGQTVQVAGKVGEVFPVGGGFAYYLHQDKDTLVVFTRVRTPRRGQKLEVAGTMSVGFLDGVSHSALFESAAPKE